MLYTGKGDKGDTGTLNSKERVSKGSLKPETLGSLDEINSLLGVCKALSAKEKFTVAASGETVEIILHSVQENLFIIQTEVAGSPTTLGEDKVRIMEQVIAHIEKELPEIKTFRIAGGTLLSAVFDYARTVARRAERTAVRAKETGEVVIGEHSQRYLNRLSSLLYAFARLTNAKFGIKEESPKYK